MFLVIAYGSIFGIPHVGSRNFENSEKSRAEFAEKNSRIIADGRFDELDFVKACHLRGVRELGMLQTKEKCRCLNIEIFYPRYSSKDKVFLYYNLIHTEDKIPQSDWRHHSFENIRDTSDLAINHDNMPAEILRDFIERAERKCPKLSFSKLKKITGNY